MLLKIQCKNSKKLHEKCYQIEPLCEVELKMFPWYWEPRKFSELQSRKDAKESIPTQTSQKERGPILQPLQVSNGEKNLEHRTVRHSVVGSRPLSSSFVHWLWMEQIRHEFIKERFLWISSPLMVELSFYGQQNFYKVLNIVMGLVKEESRYTCAFSNATPGSHLWSL